MPAEETFLSEANLSIIVASTLSPASLENCLKHLLANDLLGTEIIVADCSLKNSFASFAGNYPNIRFLQFASKTTLPVLLAAGLTRATGEIIAMTDTSCAVADNWVAAILQAHQSSRAQVIGGAVDVFGARKIIDWAAYFCDYAEFIPPLAAGAANVVPGNNISFKRSMLAESREFSENGFWKTLWCQKLQEKGIELRSEPSIMVYFTKSYSLLPFLERRFQHGRCFAGMRIARLSWQKRAFYLFGSFLLPFVFLPRATLPILAKKRFLKELFLSLPIILAAIVCWSFGETCGYFAGAGKSCDKVS